MTMMKHNIPSNWSDNQQTVFEKVNRMLTDAPSLPCYNPDDGLIIETDECEYGIGYALMQKVVN